MGVKIFSDLILAQAEAGQFRQFADRPARIGHVVGDADAIETMKPVKINHLRHGQFAVGIIGVNVKIAQHHLWLGAAGGRRARRAGPRAWLEQSDLSPVRPVALGQD